MVGTQLQVLEGFELRTAVSPIDLPVGMQRLLALLAVRGAAHRCVVAGTMWPDVPEAHALANLRTAMWRLNRVVPNLVRGKGAGLSLVETVSVDSKEQEAFATRLLREHLNGEPWVNEGITHLWRGELLPGWYDDWVVYERERLSQLRLHAMELAAASLTRQGCLDTALQLALEAVRLEPLRETANAVLMSVYVAEGNVCDAIHQYNLFRDLLKRELELEPSPSFDRLLPPHMRQ